MTQMRIERYTRRRGPSGRTVGCGCALLLVAGIAAAVLIGVVVLLPLLPNIGLQVAGFESAGRTDEVFSRPAPAQPAPQIQNSAPAGGVSVSAGQYGSINVEALGVRVETGTSAEGSPIAVVSLSESEVNDLCRQRTTICSAGGNGQIRNASVDLRPGGAVINADFLVPQIGTWQRAGIVMTVDSQRARLNVEGVDIDGALFRAPPDGLGQYITQVESTANDVLRQVALQTAGETYRLDTMFADDSRITMYMRR